jgi:glycosyltransferase involved in cell wall biosynthesis
MNWLACRLQNWGLKRTDIIIAQSEDQRRGFRDNFGINAQVVPSICESLNPSCAVEMTSDGSVKEVDVLWAGNSLPKKRQEVVFELARLLSDRTFAIAMNKSDDVRFAEATKEAEKLPNVTFLGTVSPVEMEEWFKKTKLFLNTSIREGFPNTFLQAWMNGVPVVSLNIDPDKIIEKNRLGHVVNKKEGLKDQSDFNDLARDAAVYVETLLNDNVIRKEMEKRAVLYIKKNHSPSVVVTRLINALTFYYF